MINRKVSAAPIQDMFEQEEGVVQETIEKKRYKNHFLAEIFPKIDEADFLELVADIKKNGLRNAIWIHNDRILDGRNRYEACMQAGVEPVFKEYDGENPTEFVVSMNLTRRHLDESQRAMIGAKLKKLDYKGNLFDVSESVHVSKRTIASAEAVINKGGLELIKAVEDGEIPVSVGEKIIKTKKVKAILKDIKAGTKPVDALAKVVRKDKKEFTYNDVMMIIKGMSECDGFGCPTDGCECEKEIKMVCDKWIKVKSKNMKSDQPC